jgi:NADH:ubiquinone oxidoreductase subunit 3 (subunit A)
MLPTVGQALLVFSLVGALGALLVCTISWLVRPIRERKGASATYECGMPALGEHRGIGFAYLGYAVLFLAFDALALLLFLAAASTLQRAALTWLGIALLLALLLIAYGTRKRRYYVA